MAEIPESDARKIAHAGLDALRAGNAGQARELLERATNTGQADASTWIALGYACVSVGDRAAALSAADRALELEPTNLRALIFKGDCLDAAGDTRGAGYLYRKALGYAPQAGQLPQDLRVELARAQANCNRYTAQFEEYLRGRHAAQYSDSDGAGARFAQSLDILFGRKQIYLQQPRDYYFPGLAQIQFFDRSMFPWLAELEGATADIRAELEQLIASGAMFDPYVESDALLPRKDQAGMLNNPDWSAFYLCKTGETIAANAARCPRTLKALAAVPAIQVRNRSPSILFSRLLPGAHIPPHTGRINTRLICHLPLIVPEQCALRVGNETRTVTEGKAWVFDDTIEHEAWNRSNRDRVILIFEIWRPELTAVERQLITEMFDAIDTHRGEKPAWDI
jgi:aspartate beta-hydroxylase